MLGPGELTEKLMARLNVNEDNIQDLKKKNNEVTTDNKFWNPTKVSLLSLAHAKMARRKLIYECRTLRQEVIRLSTANVLWVNRNVLF